MTLLTTEVRILRKANEALSKRRRAKKTRICQGGALIVADAHDIITQKDAKEQVQHDKGLKEGDQNERQSTTQRCNLCKMTGHNARTCQDTIIVSIL